MLSFRNLLPLRPEPAEIFSTDHLMGDLKSRSARGGLITVITQGTKMCLQVCSVAVLARLLTPADFGLVAMVAVFTGLVALFQDLGLSMATVQRAKITHHQVSTLFWINIALSTGLMCVGMAISPFVAWLYGEPELVMLTIAISATFLCGGIGVQHVALLRRQMRFKALAVAQISGECFGLVVGITMAVLGAGYWSLVVMGGATVLGNSLCAFWMSGWLPGRPRRGIDIMPMIKYGGALTGTNLMTFINRQYDNVLIGAVWGAGPLGVYAKAYGLLYQPIKQINRPLSSVAITALSKLQDDPKRYRTYFKKGNQALMFVGMPVVGACYIGTEAIVAVLLGEQWGAAVPIFRYLAPAAFVGTTYTATAWAYLSLGLTGRQFRWRVVDTICTVCVVSLGVPYGPEGVAIALSCAVVLLRPFALYYCFKATPLTIMDFISAAWIPFTATMVVVAGMSAFWRGSEWIDNPFLRLFIEVPTFGALYILLVCLLPGGRQIFRIINALKR